ncbi:MAG: hypothetical protein ACRDKE_06360 [Solirubrobacterales bacterium]
MTGVDRSEFIGLVDELEQKMIKARALGLVRTSKKLHKALLTARGEIPEVLPPPGLPRARAVIIGPSRKQRS